MSGVIPRNLKKNDDSISNRFPGVHKRDTHTHTHDDSIRRNAMRCILPKNAFPDDARTVRIVKHWELAPPPTYDLKSIATGNTRMNTNNDGGVN